MPCKPVLPLAIDARDWCVIAGAPDHEMKRCIQRAHQAGLTIIKARNPNTPSQRCTVEQAAIGQWQLPPKLPARPAYLLLELNLQPEQQELLQKHGAQTILTLDHHASSDPPFSTLHQLNTFLLGGVDELMLAHYDHDAEHAYHYWGNQLLQTRLRWSQLTPHDFHHAEQYLQKLVPLTPNLLLGTEPPPNILVWDALLLQKRAALLRSPQNGTEHKYTLGGATRQAQTAIEQVYARAKQLGWRTYRTRALGGLFVPPHVTLTPTLLGF